MERRKLIAGLGSLTAAGAAGLGTGAFTSVTADRTMNVAVADDANAFLSLDDVDGSPNSEYVDTTGNQITLNLDSASGGGSGFNANSETRIDDLVRVANQGSQTVNVWVTLNGGSTFDDDTLYFYPGDATETALNNGEGDSDGDNVLGLTPGESANLGAYIDLGNVSSTSETPTATFHANVDEGGSQQVDDTGGSFAVVANDGSGDFSDLQTAIDNASGSTIAIKDTGTSYDIGSPLIINKSSLEVRGLQGKPTLQYTGPYQESGTAVPGVLVSESDVTLEDLRFEMFGRGPSAPGGKLIGGNATIKTTALGLTARNCDFTLEPSPYGSQDWDTGSGEVFAANVPASEGAGGVTFDDCLFTNNSDGLSAYVKTQDLYGTGQDTPYTDGSGNVVSRTFSASNCTFGDTASVQCTAGDGQAFELTGSTFTGEGVIDGYPEGDIVISGTDFTNSTGKSGSGPGAGQDILILDSPSSVNGTSSPDEATATTILENENTNAAVSVAYL